MASSSIRAELQEMREKLDKIESMASWVGSDEWRRRQAKGIANAKAQGKQIGRKRLPMPRGFNQMADMWARDEISAKAAADALGMSYRTFVRRAKERAALQVGTGNAD